MDERIKDGLERAFVKHRLVLWHDQEKRFAEDFEAMDIPKVKKITVNHDEFAIKHRVFIEEPNDYFLIYRTGDQPDDEENWLLDIEVGYGVFTADKADLIRSELNLPLSFVDLIRQHMAFFAARARIEKLKSLMSSTDGKAEIRRHMLAVCAGSDSSEDAIVEALLGDLANESEATWQLIDRSGLGETLWGLASSRYGYASQDPSITNMAEALFSGAYAAVFGDDTQITSDASVLLNRWSGMVASRPTFMALSDRLSVDLNISADLQSRPFEQVATLRLFKAADEEVLKVLIQKIEEHDITFDAARKIILERRGSLWYDEFKDLYEALLCAAELQDKLVGFAAPEMTFESGVTEYADKWFKIDQLYRKFVLHRGRTVFSDHLETLFTKVEHLYTDVFVPGLNAGWQKVIDKTDNWRSSKLVEQRRFFEAHVAPIRNRKSKVVVIISDAMRYEVGEELFRRIRNLQRFDAKMSSMLGVIPSYTQLV